ncbi:MAG: hypothetical protein QOE76_2508 [Frankiales bacterium]|nr:hypothetical protein [Frankiales bacterium]
MEKTVRNYYAAVNRAIKDPSALQSVSDLYTSACQQCAQDKMGIAQFHSKHERLEGGGYKLISVKAVASDENGGGVTVTYTVPASVEYDRNSKIVARFPAHPKRSAGLTVRRASGKWLIGEYTLFGNTT